MMFRRQSQTRSLLITIVLRDGLVGADSSNYSRHPERANFVSDWLLGPVKTSCSGLTGELGLTHKTGCVHDSVTQRKMEV